MSLVTVYHGPGRPGEGADLMGWMFIDDAFTDSPRLLRAGKLIGRLGRSRAMTAWFDVLTYSRKHLCGGRLELDLVEDIVDDVHRERVIDALVKVGLWDRPNGDGSIRICGYEDYYGDDEASRRQLDARRKERRKARDRKLRKPSRAGSRARDVAGSRAGADAPPPDTDTDTE